MLVELLFTWWNFHFIDDLSEERVQKGFSFGVGGSSFRVVEDRVEVEQHPRILDPDFQGGPVAPGNLGLRKLCPGVFVAVDDLLSGLFLDLVHDQDGFSEPNSAAGEGLRAGCGIAVACNARVDDRPPRESRNRTGEHQGEKQHDEEHDAFLAG